MSGNDFRVEVDLEDAVTEFARRYPERVDDGARKAVSQLSVLAENAMKAEAPEGAQTNPPSLRDSVETRPSRSTESLERTVMPRKRTTEGWPLVRAIVGNPSTPTYTDKRPPAGPLIEWADAKFGDPSLGWALQEKIFQEGHETFPNRFVARSVREWRGEVEDVAGEAIREALE